MSTDVATVQPTTRQVGRRNASAPQRVTGRLKRTLDMMVWDGKTDNQACVKTGLSLSALRIAMRKTHVRSYYHGQLEVLRTREDARNIHTLMEVRDQKRNQMARVQAVRAMRGDADDANAPSRRGQAQVPGVTIQIVAGPQPVTINGTASAHEP